MGDYLYIKTGNVTVNVATALVSMYLIPFIKTENKFWEILLFILGVLLIVISLLSPPKIKFWK